MGFGEDSIRTLEFAVVGVVKRDGREWEEGGNDAEMAFVRQGRGDGV